MTVSLARNTAVAAALTTAVSGLAVFWFAVRLTGLDGSEPAASAATVPFVLGMIVLAATGALVVRGTPGSGTGWLLIGTGLLGVLGRLTFVLAVFADQLGHPFSVALGWATNWAWIPAQTLALLLLLRFPDGRLPSRAWRPLEVTVLAWGLIALTVTALVPGPLAAEQLAPATNPIGVVSAASLLDRALTVLFMLQPLLLLLAVAGAVLRWLTADRATRRQLMLVGIALLILAVATPFALALEAAVVVEGVAWLLLPGSVAYAVVRHGLWDVDLRGRLERLRRVREAERARLQRDLHDSLGPMLGSISMRVEAARNLVAAGETAVAIDRVLESIGSDTERAVVEVRRFIDELGPTVLAENGLITALEDLVARYEEAGMTVTLVRPVELPALDPAVEIALYHVAGEALRNALRHANAGHCLVTLRLEGTDVELVVTDNGTGLRGQPEGVGRRAMAQRVAELGGVFSLTEPTEGGVQVSARLMEALR